MLRLSEERQNLGVGPFVVAKGRPGIKVLRQTTLHRLAVNGRSTTNYPSLGYVNLALFLGDGPAQGPVVLRVLGFGIPGATKFNIVRDVIGIRIIRSCF